MGSEWIGFVGAIFGAILGAIFGSVLSGVFTYIATMKSLDKSHRQNLELKEKAKNENVRGVLLSIKSEIEAMRKIYEADTVEVWKTYSADEPFEFIYDVNQDYFVVFDSNASIIGQIDNDDLRKAIIVTYMTIKGLVDSHLYHNKLVREFQQLPGKYRKLVREFQELPDSVKISEISEDERERTSRLMSLIMATSKSLHEAYLDADEKAVELIKFIDSSKFIRV